VAQRVPVGLGS